VTNSRSDEQVRPQLCNVAPEEAQIACVFTSSIQVTSLLGPRSSLLATSRWLYVLAAATPESFGDPSLVDDTLLLWTQLVFRPAMLSASASTANALPGYKLGTIARARGKYVVFGGTHATLYPNEAQELGGPCRGQGRWGCGVVDGIMGLQSWAPLPVYEGGRIEAASFLPARWDLVP
jgi:hypothetical protein